MAPPRPTRRMYGYFKDDVRLPKEIRGQNLFYTTEEDYLYCTAAGKAVRRSDAEGLRLRGLVEREEQELTQTRRQRGSMFKDRGVVILLALGCILMLAANVYVLLARG